MQRALRWCLACSRGRGGRVDRARLTRLAAYRDFFNVNANLFVRTLALDATFTFFTAQGARFGEVVLAANAILMNLQLLMSFALDGLANAAEALVGEAWGARGRARLQRAVRLSLAWSLAVAAGFSVLFAGFGPQLVAVLTDQASVRAAVATYLPWMILSPLISVFSFLYDGVFVGATLGCRHAQHHACIQRARVPAHLVARPRSRQSRTVAGIHHIHARARRRHGMDVPPAPEHTAGQRVAGSRLSAT